MEQIQNEEIRKCIKCGAEKPISQFFVRKRKEGPSITYSCQECGIEAQRRKSLKSYYKHREERNEYATEYQRNNKEYFKQKHIERKARKEKERQQDIKEKLNQVIRNCRNKGNPSIMVEIYMLRDPRDNSIQYVGKAKDVKDRLKQHKSNKKDNKDKIAWINKLESKGLEPITETIEIVAEPYWAEREIYWIAYYRSLGIPLLNRTNGGDGMVGYVFTKEHKKNMSLARRGIKVKKTKKKKSKYEYNAKEKIKRLTNKTIGKITPEIAQINANKYRLRKSPNASSKYIGVMFCDRGGKKNWIAKVAIKNKSVHLKYFESEIYAAKSVDEKCLELFGYKPNFPD